MATLRTLKKQAREAASARGHVLERFTTSADGLTAFAQCKRNATNPDRPRCHMWVRVDTHPAPNGIDIGGDAIAVNCKATRDGFHMNLYRACTDRPCHPECSMPECIEAARAAYVNGHPQYQSPGAKIIRGAVFDAMRRGEKPIAEQR